MNRKQKIVVSIVGITIVALSLLGFTYAYYLTRIEGNTNTNSISITTADLKLTYGDGDGSIIGSGKILEPDNDNPVGTKVFTVTNNGNSIINDYAVIIENFAVKYHSGSNAGVVTDLVNGEDGNPDMKLVISCKSYKNYGKNEQDEVGTCAGMDGFLPEKSDILLTNDIDKEITHEYTAVLTYLEDGTNQSDDMNKTIEGRFNIIDTKNTIDVTGTVENANPGDTVTIHSEPKESVIYTDGTYKFMGVKPDVHTIKVNGEEKGKVSIKGGTEADTTGTTTNNGTTMPEVTITDESRILTVNLKSDLEITSIKDYNPYSEGTLAYNIYQNAKDNKNGTQLLKVSDTPIASDIARYIGEITYTDTSWDYGTYTKLHDVCNAPSATTCTSDMIGLYIGQNCQEPLGIISKCDNGKPVYTGYTNEYESSLVIEQDDIGNSYYYRGDVEDNYVTFANKCWRIVRIQGDGSTKLILEDKDQLCSTNINGNWDIYTSGNIIKHRGNFGYTQYDVNILTASDGTKNSEIRYLMDYLHGQTTRSESLPSVFYDFQNKFSKTSLSKLKSGNWCLGDEVYSRTGNSSSTYQYTLLNETQMMDNKIKGTAVYYDSYVRLTGYNKDGFQPTLKCNGTIMNDWEDNDTNPTPMYVGAITADEVVYAGGKMGTEHQNYYLINDYQITNGKEFWLLSPHSFYNGFDTSYTVKSDGRVLNSSVKYDNSFRPAVSLNANVKIKSGDGTLQNPYIIDEG